jgi:cytochrome c heme-lyase
MSADKCPVDHKSSSDTPCSIWNKVLPHSSSNALAITASLEQSSSLSSSSSSPGSSVPVTVTVPVPVPDTLSTSREVSSIPRTNNENWVYPSEAQFYAAMARKKQQQDPNALDMRVVVPIHNAVNERAWSHIREWEAGRGGECCGGVRLVSFKGRPGEPSPKARILTLLG